MIKLAIKKIINNRLLMLSLFAGMLVAVLIACTIPIYSAGISHRMFVTQLETYQNENSVSPGAVTISCSLTAFRQTADKESNTVGKKDSSANVANFEFCTNYLNNELYKKMYMPALVKSVTLSTASMVVGDERDSLKNTVNNVTVRATEDYTNAVDIVAGKLPSKDFDSDGCIEVMLSRAAQHVLHYSLGTVLQLGSTKADILNQSSEGVTRLKIVGLFDYKEDPLNPIADTDNGSELYCDYDMFYNELFVKQNYISKVTWYYAGDYTKYDLTKTDKTIEALEELNKNIALWGLSGNATTSIPPVDQYIMYSQNVDSVNILLVLFYAPILILIVFFIFMISKFVIENDKNEISMLNSRGASRRQIVMLYLCQGGMLAAIGVLIAPALSLLLCSLLGTTSGFMEFAQRAPMKLGLSFSSVMFALLAGILAVVTMLVPVYRAARVEIVEHKRSRLKSPIVSNIILLVTALLFGAVSAYSFYVLVMQKGGLITAAGKVQPLAYLLLICFFAAFALLFVLAYPLALKLAVKIGRKKWNASTYSACSRISRMEMREKFIVIFLMLTVAIGVFSSISARTLNKNLDNSTRYRYPCDIISDVTFYAKGNEYYLARPYFFDELEDSKTTRVITGNEPRVNTGYNSNISQNITFMGIDPKEFGSIITWDDSILPKPMSYYLGLLQKNTTGCILSKNAATALGKVKVGDNVNIRPDNALRGGAVIRSEVLAVVDAWPTYYPTQNGEKNYLVVVNSQAVEEVAGAYDQPYQVWMNTDKSVDELKMFAIHNFARLTNIRNGARELYLSDINAVRQATNGSLTLGFIAVIVVCAIGFAIYWVISVKSRTLQIGTMRALGMSLKEIYKMIITEQILLCAAAVLLGVGAGILSGFMFAPLLQSAFETMGNMPPYTVAVSVIDIIKLIILIAVLIAIGTFAAFAMLKRINAASAIKLGEE